MLKDTLNVMADALEIYIEQRRDTEYPQNEVAIAQSEYRKICARLEKAKNARRVSWQEQGAKS
jgi:hypothetical protein